MKANSKNNKIGKAKLEAQMVQLVFRCVQSRFEQMVALYQIKKNSGANEITLQMVYGLLACKTLRGLMREMN